MSASADAYAEIAAWYDVEHDPVTADVEAYASLIAEQAGDRARVIEIGAGSGRVAAALAVAGHDVTAVEPSAAMRARLALRLAQLPERAARRIHAIEGTAQAPGTDARQRFDVALLGQNLLAHLTTVRERHEALLAMRARLAPGGHLLADIDLLGPRRLLETARQLWWQGMWALPSSTQVEHTVTGLPGPAPGTLEIIHRYDVSAPGAPLSRTISRMTLALLSRGEVEVALLRAGFEVAAVYGDYDLTPYEEGSPRAIFDA
ncbi:MAG: class I SAM-dependent methyltransferase, partial [Ktedonobacterales bacterium]